MIVDLLFLCVCVAISRKTPLLCENRRPKGLPRRAKWPILVCCRTPMCNQAHLPLDALVADDDVDDDDASRGGNPPISSHVSISTIGLLAKPFVFFSLT